MSMPAPRRSWLVPEVIQTSATDCGPATLKAIAAGTGRRFSYDALRTVCQTGIDGTSIDDIEHVANELGMGAEQTMLPPDHLVSPQALAHPMIAIVRDPIGEAHFVAVWRRFAGRMQLMDPTSGRRWPTLTQFVRDLYIHEAEVPAELWRGWAAGPEFLDVVDHRLRRLGLAEHPEVRARLRQVTQEPDHRPIATFDAVVRLTQSLVDSGAVARGREAARLLCRTFDGILDGSIDPQLVDNYWFARPIPNDNDDDEPRVVLRGAVLIRLGVSEEQDTLTDAGDTQPLPRSSLLDQVREGADRQRFLFALRSIVPLQRHGLLWLAALLVVLALGSLAEVALLHSALELVEQLTLPAQKLAGFFGLLGLTLALLALELGTLREAARLGRALEGRIRLAFSHKLPRMRLEYFRSRLPSDLATRSQRVHELRSLPHLVRHVVLVTAQLVAVATLLVWLDPLLLWPTVAAITAAGAAAIAVYGPLRERDLKVQSLDGNLSNAYLDAMLGLAPAQAHGAEATLEREHQRLLEKWRQAGHTLQRSLAATDGVQALVGSCTAVWLITDHLVRAGSDAGGVILIVYLALSVSVLGAEMVQILRVLPRVRNIAQRQLEPLHCPEWMPQAPAAEHDVDRDGPVAIEFADVGLTFGGHDVLDAVSLRIGAGDHVAIVGPSGAGKSSVLSLLLRKHAPTHGQIFIDGTALADDTILGLRDRTAWVDPSAQLWNRSLLSNIVFGSEDCEQRPIGSTLRHTHIDTVVEHLEDGLQTTLGEEGRRLSGGEGQRVRLGRAWCRPRPGLVLLDEPFRGLEHELRNELLETTRRRWAGSTLLCVTHDVEQTKAFDRVIVIDGGRVVEDGCPGVLARDRDSRYSRLLRAERALFTDAWASQRWRHVRIADGTVTTDRSASAVDGGPASA